MAKQKPVIIILDSREKDEEFIEYLKRFGAKITVMELPVGDIHIPGRLPIVMEHKGINDLGSSISDGRLFKQIKDLVDGSDDELPYQPMYLLIGEAWRLWKTRGFNEWEIAPLLNSIIAPPPLGWGIPCIEAHNNRFAAERGIALARKNQSEHSDKVYPVRYGKKRKMSNREQALFILEGFPSISAVRSNLILDTYGTVDEALKAMKDGTITDLSGISTITANKIKESFSFRSDEDGKPD